MITLYIMCGLPFSGKSTLAAILARQTNSSLVSFDSIYLEKRPEFNEKMSWVDQQKSVHTVAFDRIREALKKNESVVYDDTNLRLAERKTLHAIASEFGVKSVVVFMDTAMEALKDRERCDMGSRFSVGKETMRQAFKRFQPPLPEENVVVYTPDMVRLDQ